MSTPRKLKQSDGTACPHCGGTRGFYANVRVFGWEERSGDWGGHDEEMTSNDKVRYRDPRTARCQDCLKAVEYPKLRR